MMMIIKDKHNKIIQRSRNLRGIRRYVSKNTIKDIIICKRLHERGDLAVNFIDGAHLFTEFASFIVLKGFVRNWRNVHGAELIVDNIISGRVSYDNIALWESEV